MNLDQFIVLLKTLYHLVAALVLFYILYKINFKQVMKSILFVMMLLHFFDAYWFYTHEGNAPI